VHTPQHKAAGHNLMIKDRWFGDKVRSQRPPRCVSVFSGCSVSADLHWIAPILLLCMLPLVNVVLVVHDKRASAFHEVRRGAWDSVITGDGGGCDAGHYSI
jgi:hypothetical protein